MNSTSGTTRLSKVMEIVIWIAGLGVLAVPEVQKAYFVRNRDLAQLKVVLPEFLQAMNGPFWKFRMAVEFHDAGHFQEWNWKAKYSLWCSALESIFTCEGRGHRYSFVATERIKWLIGEGTPIYTPEDDAAVRLVGDTPVKITVKDVLDDLYEVRNCIAHGRKIPDRFFNMTIREYCGQRLNKVQVLLEALSVIVRTSVLKILTAGLLSHFADNTSAEAYYMSHDMIESKLRAKLAARPNRRTARNASGL